MEIDLSKYVGKQISCTLSKLGAKVFVPSAILVAYGDSYIALQNILEGYCPPSIGKRGYKYGWACNALTISNIKILDNHINTFPDENGSYTRYAPLGRYKCFIHKNLNIKEGELCPVCEQEVE